MTTIGDKGVWFQYYFLVIQQEQRNDRMFCGAKLAHVQHIKEMIIEALSVVRERERGEKELRGNRKCSLCGGSK